MQFKINSWEPYIDKISDILIKVQIDFVRTFIGLSAGELVKEIYQILKKENEYCLKYYSKSKEIINTLIEDITIKEHAENIGSNANTGVYKLLKNNKYDDLNLIFTLFNNSENVSYTLKYILKPFQDYLSEFGNQFLQFVELEAQQKKPQKEYGLQFIHNIIKIKELSDHIVANVFENNIVLRNGRDFTFMNILNKLEKSTFFLAMYSDTILKKELDEQQANQCYDHVVQILGYLHSKDIFFKHYQKFFSMRFLNRSTSASGSLQDEKNLLAKLKQENGQNSVQKISTMFTDLEFSDQFYEQYKNQYPFLFKVSFLTEVCWHNILIDNQTTQINTPPQLQIYQQQILKTYQDQNPRRDVRWSYQQGNAEVRYQTQDSKGDTIRYQLLITTLQLILIMTIDNNPNKKISIEDLNEITGIHFKNILISLEPFVNQQILISDTEKFNQNSTIYINPSLNIQKRKLKLIPSGKMQSQKQEAEFDKVQNDTSKEIEQDRQFILDSYIVRIMKQRKQLEFNELINEVIKLCNLFKPDIKMIKIRIESLQDREYLVRKGQSFQYLP